MGGALNCNKNSSKNEEINFLVSGRKDEIKFDDIVEIIANSEIEIYQKPISTILQKHFSNIIPNNKLSNMYFKKQKFEGILKKYKQDKTKSYVFQDIFFRPETRNIAYIDKNIVINKIMNKRDVDELSMYKFSPISRMSNYEQFFKVEKTSGDFLQSLLSNQISIEGSSVKFNNYGNLNLYNCIIFLLQCKHWVNNIITRMDLNRKLFVIKLYVQGKPKSILIDDHIPIINIDNVSQPAFINVSDHFWILLIEKAVAKVNRSYGNIIRSLGSELIPLLTDAPMITIRHNMNHKKKLWETFIEAGKNNWIIFSEFDSMSLEYYNSEYFISYFLVNIFKVNGNKYVELSIPENDANNFLIKNKLQSKIPEKDLANTSYFKEEKLKNNKIIYMSLETFYESFSITCMIMYQPNYSYNFKNFQAQNSEFNLTKIKIDNKTKLILTMHLKQIRYFLKINNYEVPISRLIIAKMNVIEKYIKCRIKKSNLAPNDISLGDESSNSQSRFEEDFDLNLEYINSTYGKQEKHIMELELDEGTYYIFFKVYTDMQFNIVLSTYSHNFLQFEDNFNEIDAKLIRGSDNAHLINSINELFSSYLDKNGSSKIVENNKLLVFSHSLTDYKFGFSLIKFENKSKELVLNVNLQFENQGMNLISHEKETKMITQETLISSNTNKVTSELIISIPPKSKEIVIFEWMKNLNEISINVKPNFKIEVIRPSFEEKDLFNKNKTFITNEIFYYEITYSKGIFIVIVNESEKDYIIHIEFEKLENLIIFFPKECQGKNSVDLFLAKRAKSYVNLKIIKEDSISFKINFQLKIIDRKLLNKSAQGKI